MTLEVNRRTFLRTSAGLTMMCTSGPGATSLKAIPIKISPGRLTEIIAVMHNHSLFKLISNCLCNGTWGMGNTVQALKKVKEEVPELEHRSVVELMSEYLDGLNGGCNPDGSVDWSKSTEFFDLDKTLSLIKFISEEGSKSKNPLIQSGVNLVTTQAVSDFQLSFASVNLNRAIRAFELRLEEKTRIYYAQRAIGNSASLVRSAVQNVKQVRSSVSRSVLSAKDAYHRVSRTASQALDLAEKSESAARSLSSKSGGEVPLRKESADNDVEKITCQKPAQNITQA